MKKLYCFFLVIIFPVICFCQKNVYPFTAQSEDIFAFRVTAVEAEQFIQWDSIPLDHFVNKQPTVVFQRHLYDESLLPTGNYVLLSAEDNYVKATFSCISNLVAIEINNKHRLQLDIRDKEGVFAEGAKVFINNKRANYNVDSKTFWSTGKRSEEAFVKVYALSDTLYLTLSKKDDYSIQPLFKQRLQNFRSTKIYRWVSWLPLKVKGLFRSQQYHSNRIGANGYIIFNQPKYKPLDTVKYKGYVVNRRGKQYAENIAVHLTYHNKDRNIDQLVATLPPSSPGAFVGQFVLADTIPMDVTCRLVFETTGQKQIIQNYFKTEEYVLDEVSSYHLKSDKELYFKNDSLRFFASATDANGLNILDAKATLTLTSHSIDKFYSDTIWVPDTIYEKELPLSTIGDTKFTIAAAALPKVDVTISVKLVFKNSNNELHEESTSVEYKYLSHEIAVTQHGDSLQAMYIENGTPIDTTGEFAWNDEVEKPIHFPTMIKIDPLATDYSFYVNDDKGKAIAFENVPIKADYRLTLSRISKGDTLGFVLSNPYKIPVYFTVFNGNHVVVTGKGAGESITWKKVIRQERQAYKIRWQYMWGGEEQQGEETIGLLYKLLKVQINSNKAVYPGQKDSISIDVTDFKGNPASNVNLTAVSYNNQFNKDIRLQEPPYLAKYKSKKGLLYQSYENDEGEFTISKKYLLGENAGWVSRFHLDTMAYYKLLFPEKGVYDAVTAISSFVPQLSVNVVHRGVPQEVYLLYINRQLVYYNGVTDRMKYAFQVFPGTVQIGIRLKDKYLEIDSLYIQPNYKHDLSFDLDNLPAHSGVTPADKHWSYSEMNLLEESIWQMQNNRENNHAYLWQGDRVVRFNGDHQHTAGPFTKNEMTFFSPGNFDIRFNFETGYEYSVSKQVVRLEKRMLFPRKDLKNALPDVKNSLMQLGDTVAEAPVIVYPTVQRPVYLKRDNQYGHDEYAFAQPGKGTVQFTKPKDSVFYYLILEPADGLNKRIISVENSQSRIKNVLPGSYVFLMVTSQNYIAESGNILVRANGTTCVEGRKLLFFNSSNLLNNIVADNNKIEEITKEVKIPEPPKVYNSTDENLLQKFGGAAIAGIITDKSGGNPIAGASVLFKGYRQGTISDGKGYFSFSNLRTGNYKLVISSVGYESKEIEVHAGFGEAINLKIQLNASTSHLDEVVVTGYGVVRKKELTGSITVVNGADIFPQQMLQGKVAGLTITNNLTSAVGDSKILIRGISSLSQQKLLYVIDGIMYDDMPGIFDVKTVQEIVVLKDAEAMALYGARASGGAVVITTQAKTFRTKFKDYALWEPNFFTDKNGHAAIEINYPDNITAWKTYVVAMDKKRRVGKAFTVTQAYKPMVAELSVPEFLLEGDSTSIIGKAKNYTGDKYNIATAFTLNGNLIAGSGKELLPNAANIASTSISPATADTLIASYTLQSNTGFKDGEERKIPVFKKGTEETAGNFWVLQNDTTVTFTALSRLNTVHIFAQNNTLDLMLEELEHLRKYPFYCMEQTASKLTGLALEKKIKMQLDQPFGNQATLDKLLQKIQQTQLFDGGWAWWENGKSNFNITNYVTNALLQFRDKPLVESNIRNAFLYLQNQLPFFKTAELLSALFTLSNGSHEMDYAQWINKINYDSLSQHQQWQWISIKQQQHSNYKPQLEKLVAMRINTMFGGVHWGADNNKWYSNDIATTILAYKVIEKDSLYRYLANPIVQYFLEKKHNGYWNNTVESATVLDAILPHILSQQSNFTDRGSITVTGDTSFMINKFPYLAKLNEGRVKNLSIKKSGGGIIYCTAYQQYFNVDPKPAEDKFIIHTYFTKNNENIKAIKAGEKIKMIVAVDVLKDAEYVQLEVPIPAGCTYASKNNDDWKVYKEFCKDKVLLFTESLSKGLHQFEIELEPRYSGSYSINPAKASLMYFPVFYGRNELKKIAIIN